MDAQGSDFAGVRFSSDDLPERDRIPAWRDFFAPRIFSAEIEPAADVPFRTDVTIRALPGLSLMSARSTLSRLSRTPALLADGRDGLGLIVSSSDGVAQCRDRELACGAGSAFVFSAAEATSTTSPSPAHYFGVLIPPKALADRVPGLSDAVPRLIPAGHEHLAYLVSYMRFVHEAATLDHELARAATSHLYDLVALVLGASRDAAFVAERCGLRAARLLAIKRHVADHLGDYRLSVGALAAHHRVTPRYVQRLFQSEGTTFSEFVLNQRLARVRNMLDDPRRDGWTVSAIALAAGFGDISYFNRCFRRRYGVSPTELRRQGSQP
ncbi:MAG: AraC family transcriptional regulator [Propylenella sp.]